MLSYVIQRRRLLIEILPATLCFCTFPEGFADEMKKARKVGEFKQYIVGRSSEATFADAFEKQEAIIRCLGGFDPTGEVVSFLFSFLIPV